MLKFTLLVAGSFFISNLTFAQTSASTVVTAPVATPEVVEWKPRFDWSGDLRYRGNSLKQTGEEQRVYQQLRARLGLKADVNEQTQAIFRLATGTKAISTNQDLGDRSAPGVPRRSIGLDQAYVSYKPASAGQVLAGRVANPFWSPAKVQLVYDSDLNFEGAAVKWESPMESSSLFVNAGLFTITELYTTTMDDNDLGLGALQAGYSLKTEGAGTWTVHAALHQYLNINNKLVTTTASTTGLGNTTVGTGANIAYKNKYSITEVGLEWKSKMSVGDLTFYADFVKNNDVTTEDTGLESGVTLKSGAWQGGLAVITKKADSVVAAFTDSDANGGGTDNNGTRLFAAYQAAKNTQFTLTNFQAKRGVSAPTDSDFSTTQLDLIVNF